MTSFRKRVSRLRAVREKGLSSEQVQGIVASATVSATLRASGKSDVDLKPTSGMASAAKRGLEWAANGKGGSGLEPATKTRARKIANRENLSPDHVRRMHSFFSRHSVDSKAKGWNSGEEGYPSAGRVAWELWGGDGGATWAESKSNALTASAFGCQVGDWVQWDSSGGKAHGKVTGKKDDKHVVKVYRKDSDDKWQPSDTDVTHLPETLRTWTHSIIASGSVPDINSGETPPVGGGARFQIPLVIPEGIESGDGRSFAKGALSRRELPIPLMWQIQTSDGHDGSVVVGRIDKLDRTDDGMGNAEGVFDTGPYGAEAERLVKNRMLRFVSADLDRFEANELKPELSDDGEDHDDGKITADRMLVTKGRVMGVTLVAKPAFQECVLNIVDSAQPSEVPLEDGIYEEPQPLVAAAASLCAAVPVHPPKSWFNNPELNGATPITVDDSGHVYGHIASWDMDHIGMPFGTRVPQSRSNYAYFHTGVVRTDEGNDVNVGQLTLSGGHAPLSANAAMAIKHYDDTKSAIADVRAGEDAYGVWVAGALRPDVTPQQVRMFRASAPSGDWRQIKGSLELVAVCQVNVPGFPVARAQVASGAVYTLVAAGTQSMMPMYTSGNSDLESRLARLELAQRDRDLEKLAALRERMKPAREAREARAAAVREKINPLLAARREANLVSLQAAAAAQRERVNDALGAKAYVDSFKSFPTEKRDALAKKGHALPDGSFPIESESDLKNAVRAVGRADESKRAQVRKHIVKRARGMGKTDAVPSDWTENSMTELELMFSVIS